MMQTGKLFAYQKVASDNTLQRLAAKVAKLHLADKTE